MFNSINHSLIELVGIGGIIGFWLFYGAHITAKAAYRKTLEQLRVLFSYESINSSNRTDIGITSSGQLPKDAPNDSGAAS